MMERGAGREAVVAVVGAAAGTRGSIIVTTGDGETGGEVSGARSVDSGAVDRDGS